jgi:hypothetical protein
LEDLISINRFANRRRGRLSIGLRHGSMEQAGRVSGQDPDDLVEAICRSAAP